MNVILMIIAECNKYKKTLSSGEKKPRNIYSIEYLKLLSFVSLLGHPPKALSSEIVKLNVFELTPVVYTKNLAKSSLSPD